MKYQPNVIFVDAAGNTSDVYQCVNFARQYGLNPHSPYTDFVAGVGCQDGEPQTTCNPSTVGDQTATPTSPQTTPPTCTAFLPGHPSGDQIVNFERDCNNILGSTLTHGMHNSATCTFPSTQTCPPPTGSTQTPTVVNGRCTIQPGAT